MTATCRSRIHRARIIVGNPRSRRIARLARTIVLGAIVAGASLSASVAYALKPTRDHITTPSAHGLTHDSLNIVTKDGARLSGWLVLPERSKADAVVISSSSIIGASDVPMPSQSIRINWRIRSL